MDSLVEYRIMTSAGVSKRVSKWMGLVTTVRGVERSNFDYVIHLLTTKFSLPSQLMEGGEFINKRLSKLNGAKGILKTASVLYSKST